MKSQDVPRKEKMYRKAVSAEELTRGINISKKDRRIAKEVLKITSDIEYALKILKKLSPEDLARVLRELSSHQQKRLERLHRRGLVTKTKNFYTLNAFNGQEKIKILLCRNCLVPLRLSKFREPFCPSCLTSLSKLTPTSILCCKECKNSLFVTTYNYESFCCHCKFAPTMEDSFLKDFTPSAITESMKRG